VYLFIVNPHAGRGKGLYVWKQAELILKQQNIPYQVEFTTGKGDAIQLASQGTKEEGITGIVAVGGDGTVHEVANGLYGSNIPLGYLPAGTGNDFAREWDIPFEPSEALERILDHQVKTMDVIVSQDQVMLCYLSTGFDGYVSRRVNESSWKKWLGNASYFIGALISLPRFRPFTVQLQLDGVDHRFDDVWLVTCSNGKSFGGGMLISPQADPTDGIMDICIINKLSKLEFLHVFPKVYTGKHVGHPAVTFLQGKVAKIETAPTMWAFADGEEIGPNAVEIQVIPNALTIL
jgi:diacylglycerol kinase (ATP)